MAALATRADLEARLGRALAGTEATRADALLDDASAIVRAYTGQTIDAVADDTVRLKARRGRIRLPQRPVTAVTAVADVDANDVAFYWPGLGEIVALGVNRSGDTPSNTYDVFDVTYSHGYPDVPDVIVGIVCQVVARALTVDPDSTGYQGETIEGYSYTVGAAAAQGAAGLLAGEREVLNLFRRVGGVAALAT